MSITWLLNTPTETAHPSAEEHPLARSRPLERAHALLVMHAQRSVRHDALRDRLHMRVFLLLDELVWLQPAA